jgi:tryptophan halogenase
MKIAVIGKGTAGAISLTDLYPRLDKGLEIDWYFDPNIKTQPVGEGTTLSVPNFLNKRLNFNYTDLEEFDYCPKEGIYYYGWGKNRDPYLHYFQLSHVGMHFNAVKFQNYVYNKLKNHPNVNIFEKNISTDNIDADYIIDCSGKPSELNDDYIIPEFICVNSVHVTQCYWNHPQFRHTKTIARPYGWVFMVPLGNRCSVGYLYNQKFTSLNQVKDDVKELFYEWKLTPSNNTNSFYFSNYYKRKMLDNRILYNGNKGFFLEPMEATSIDTILTSMNMFKNYIKDNSIENEFNNEMNLWFKQVEFIIMIHYSIGSKWKNDFWAYAEDRGKKCIEKCLQDPKFYDIIQAIRSNKFEKYKNLNIGPWSIFNLKINLDGLGLKL